MTLETLLAIELRELDPICEFTQHDGYSVYQSERFRSYYGGNLVAIDEPMGRSLSDWEEVFRTHFDSALYHHKTFVFGDEERFASLIEEGHATGYNVEHNEYMYLDHARDARSVPDGLLVKRVVSEEDWERVRLLFDAASVGEPWYDPTYTGPDRLHEKRRVTAEAIGTHWLALTTHDSPEFLAVLSIFVHRDIANISDVETAIDQRRKGYATALVSEAIRYSFDVMNARGITLSADAEYHAIELYRRLGFEEFGGTVTLMKYPGLKRGGG